MRAVAGKVMKGARVFRSGKAAWPAITPAVRVSRPARETCPSTTIVCPGWMNGRGGDSLQTSELP